MLGYLLSFHYFKDNDLDDLAACAEAGGRTGGIKFFADSGAYSAHTLGAPVSLNDYAAWLSRWSHLIDPYVNLDVLYDWKAGERNQKKLERLGLHPTPVYHLGEPLDVLRRMMDGRDFVAVGNLTTTTKRDPKLCGTLDAIHGLAADAGVGLHGFGLSAWPMIKRWPWRSVDSSTVGAGFRYGVVKLYDFYSDRWVTFRDRDDAAWHRHGMLMREYGFDPAEFAGLDRKQMRVPLIKLGGAVWQKAAEVVPETDLYLVDGVFNQVNEGEKRIAHYEQGAAQVRQLAAA